MESLKGFEQVLNRFLQVFWFFLKGLFEGFKKAFF